jgi:hypothetical protein
MEINQAAGYLFEVEIMNLLEDSGFVEVKEEKLEGRGTNHQIDAHGIYSIPIPFTYPIRLIAETKCYESSIELSLVRSFFGVITDISENYFVKRGDKELKNRFLDTGCFFAANSFTKPSQDFAWAHNIFIVSFSGIRHMDSIIKRIRIFLNTLEIKESKKLNKADLIANYQNWKKSEDLHIRNAHDENPSLVFGIIDNVYPVILVGKKGWHKNIPISPDRDIIKGKKISRKSWRGSVLFEINIDDNQKGLETFYFTIPNRIAKKITGRIDKTEPGKKVFDLDIPLLSWKSGQTVRRIIKIEVELPEEKKNKSNRKQKSEIIDVKVKENRWNTLDVVQ